MEFLNSLLIPTETALELGLITSLTVIALFLSYQMLNVCDLSTDGCFTLGATVGAMVAISGHPYISILAAILSGMASGLVVGFLQTKLKINSLLAGIIVNTGLYSINIMVMENASVVNILKNETVFTKAKALFENTPFESLYKIITAAVFVAIVGVFLGLFLHTRLGYSIRATGDNPSMVKSSSINPDIMIIIGLCLSNGMTALSGCLFAQAQKSANIDIGTGMVTIALASLLIGNVFFGKRGIPLRIFGMVVGAFIFRFVYTIALKFEMPAYLLKLVSAAVVLVALSLPYIKNEIPLLKQKIFHKYGRRT